MSKRVLVIGDSCVDIFEYGKVKRISPEAPVPILIPIDERQTSGMTLNVWANLWALGIEADVLTNTDKPIKKRYVEENSNHMLLRVDRDDIIKPLDWEYLKNIVWDNYEAIVISDYNKGFLNTEQISYIANSHPLTFIDTKKKLGDWAHEIKFIKINQKEYDENISDGFQFEFAGDIIVTKGKNGAELLSDDDNLIRVEKFEIELGDEHQVRDLSGAGDTFLAGLVASYVKNKDIRKAIKFANKCAAWVVTQRGVTIIDPTKI